MWCNMDNLLVWTSFVVIFVLNLDQTHGMNNIHGKGPCIVVRNERDSIHVPVKSQCNRIKNVCKTFGAVQEDATKCICSCPTNKQTFMDNTKMCTAIKDVWPAGCRVQQSRSYKSIGVFSVTLPSASMTVNIPVRNRRCRITVDPRNSYYLDHKGWKKIPMKSGFPFRIEIRRFKRRKMVTIKWSKLSPKQTLSSYKLNGKVIRLGILVCRRIQECMLFKVSGQRMHKCTIPQPVPTSVPQDPLRPSTQITTTVLPSHPPSMADKGKRDSSSDDSGGTSWAVIGAIIGIVVILSICIIVLVLWICRRKKTFKKAQRNKAQSSSSDVNSKSESATEPAAYTLFHPYQDLKPPVRGAPPGVYHPLACKAKEDPSGYLLPSPTILGTSSNEEPIYNEIGSPQSKPSYEYDYAVPEDIVRFSAHLTDNIHNQNNPIYVGRPTGKQEGHNSHEDDPNLTDSVETGVSVQNDGLDCSVESAYVDFVADESAGQDKPVVCKDREDDSSLSDSKKSEYIDFVDEKSTSEDPSLLGTRDFQI